MSKRRSRWAGWAAASLVLAGCGGGSGVGSGGLFVSGPPTWVLTSVAPEPALPAGISPVPALSPTPLRLVGTGFTPPADVAKISLRLIATTAIFADGTATSIDVAATAATSTTVDFVAPSATLVGIDSATVDLVVGAPDGATGSLIAAFTYQAPALAPVSATPAGSPGASGIANRNLDAAGGRPLHLFARGGGDPFVLSPAAGRTFGPLPVPAAGTTDGIVDVVFRTPGSALWPGGAELAVVTGTRVSDGTQWLIQGASPSLRPALAQASTAPVDAEVSITFEDGTRQALPPTGTAPGARLLSTSERLFTTFGGLARTFGQSPGVDGVTAFADGGAAGPGPMALDAARNRLYVASGASVAAFDTAQTMDAGGTPSLGPVALVAGGPAPNTLSFAGGALTGLAVDAASGRVWAANDLGVQVVDPLVPGTPVTTLAVPPGLGATSHARRVLFNPTAGEMVVSLFDGTGAGTEALLVYDAATATLTSVWRVSPMITFRGTFANNATSIGSGLIQLYNDGSPNGNTGQQVASNVLSNNLPAATGAVWNGEWTLRPGAGSAGRVFLLYDNTGANAGTIVAANACNAQVNGVPVGLASGVSISIPSDWVNALDLTTGGSTSSDGYAAGAWPLGAGALLGPADGQRGAIAYDASRDVVVVHAAATGGAAGFAYVNVASALVGPAPSGPPYSAGTFVAGGTQLVAMITNATTVGLTLNTPNTTTPAFIPGQEQLRVLGAPGAIYAVSGGGTQGAGIYLTPTFGLLANPILGPARGSPQTTAVGIVIDSTAAPTDGAWFLLGASAAGDLTEGRFTGPGVVLTTSAGVGPTGAGSAWPVLVGSAP